MVLGEPDDVVSREAEMKLNENHVEAGSYGLFLFKLHSVDALHFKQELK